MNPAPKRFNTFQRTMLHWNSLHPYNAVHVVRIPGNPDQARLRDAINAALEARALAGLIVNQEQGTYVYTGARAACEITTLEAAESLGALLLAEIERQLNTPFLQAGPFSPFRFFVARSEGLFALGLAYLHAVADGESIVQLMKEIVADYFGSKQKHRPANEVGSEGPRARNPLFVHPGAFARKVAAFPSLIRNMRRSCRPPCRDAADLHNGFQLLSVEPLDLGRLVGSAKAWGITVNDLLLATLLKCCALLATGRKRAGRRTNLSVGCIVNTRRDLAGGSGGAFGLLLGSFVITHAVPENVGLKELAGDIARITLDIKRKKLYLATSLELSFGTFMLSFFSVERRKKMYQKNYPLWGGLTNMNINSLWQTLEEDRPVDYIRAVSTGPATPLVLSFTTSGQAANIGLSYRSTVFSASEIERFVDCFTGTVAGLQIGR